MVYPDSIPEELLPDLAQAPWPDDRLTGLRPSAAGPLSRDRLLAPLLRYGLVRRTPEHKTLHIHRLVQAALRQRMPAALQHQLVRRLTQLLDSLFPIAEYSNWDVCQNLLPHAIAVLDAGRTLQQSSLEAASLALHAAGYLDDRAAHGEAEPFHRQAIQIGEAKLGRTHAVVLTALDRLGILLNEQGQAAEAEQCLRRALAGREATLPPQHPELAGTLNNLGWLLNSQSRVAESEVFLRRALSIRETNFRPGPPALAASQNNLGWCLMRQGRNAEAEPLFRAALAVWEATYGPEPPYLVFGLHNLAAVLAATGRAEQANQLRERAQALSQLRSAPLVREQS